MHLFAAIAISGLIPLLLLVVAVLALSRAFAGEVDIGTGTVVTFGTSGFAAQLLDVKGPHPQRGFEPTSHMGTAAPGAGKIANMTFLPHDLVDGGELTLQCHFNPSTTPPIHNTEETITITFPVPAGLTNPATWASKGFVTSYEVTDPLEGKMVVNVNVKLSGNITIVAAS